MTFVPAPGCVLIQPLEEETSVASADRNYERVGKAVAVGTGVNWIKIGVPEQISVGDLIFFDEYAYRRFTYEGVDYCIVDVSHDGLWGILKHGTDTLASEVPA